MVAPAQRWARAWHGFRALSFAGASRRLESAWRRHNTARARAETAARRPGLPSLKDTLEVILRRTIDLSAWDKAPHGEPLDKRIFVP